MRKRSLRVVILTAFIMFSVVGIASADNHEDVYFQHGYKSVTEALNESEKHFGRELNLPIKLPPVEFTHHFGKLSNPEGEINDELEIEYLNLIKNNGKYHYKINVRPVEQKGNFKRTSRKVTTYLLKDGSEALFISTKESNARNGFNLLVFEKKGWQYRLSVDQRIENRVPVKMLVEIANSVK